MTTACYEGSSASDTDGSESTAGQHHGDSTLGSTGSMPATTSDSGADDVADLTGGIDTDDTTSVGDDPIAVAVGYGTRRVRSIDGVQWTDYAVVDENGGDDENVLRGVGWGNGIFVAVGGAGGGFSLRSIDGVNWTDENRDIASFVSDAAWLGDGFVAAGGNGLRMRSPDGGVTWTEQAEGLSGHFRSLAVGNGIAVAVGSTYNEDPIRGMISTTTDGLTWSDQLGGRGIAAVVFGNDVFVAVDGSGTARVSQDGVAWSDADLALGDGLYHPIFGNDTFVVASPTGYASSSDGLHWTTAPANGTHTLAARFADQYLSLDNAQIFASTDLTRWQSVFTAGGSGLIDVAVGTPSG